MKSKIGEYFLKVNGSIKLMDLDGISLKKLDLSKNLFTTKFKELNTIRLDLPQRCLQSMWIVLVIATYFFYEICQQDGKIHYLTEVCIKGVYKIQLKSFAGPKNTGQVYKLQLHEVSIAELESSPDEIVKEFLISSETMKMLACARN